MSHAPLILALLLAVMILLPVPALNSVLAGGAVLLLLVRATR